jgi:hypothetical protein
MATEAKAHDEQIKPDLEKKYRIETESKNQWNLRKRFIEAYWDKYDEDRLLCLARKYIYGSFNNKNYFILF